MWVKPLKKWKTRFTISWQIWNNFFCDYFNQHLNKSLSSPIKKLIEQKQFFKEKNAIKLLNTVNLWFSTMFSFWNYYPHFWFYYINNIKGQDSWYIYLFSSNHIKDIWYLPIILNDFLFLNGIAIKKNKNLQKLSDILNLLWFWETSNLTVNGHSNVVYVETWKNDTISFHNIQGIPFVWLFQKNKQTEWELIEKHNYSEEEISLSDYIEYYWSYFNFFPHIEEKRYWWLSEKYKAFLSYVIDIRDRLWNNSNSTLMLCSKKYINILDIIDENKPTFHTIFLEDYNTTIEDIVKIKHINNTFFIYFVELLKNKDKKIKCLKINTKNKSITIEDNKSYAIVKNHILYDTPYEIYYIQNMLFSKKEVLNWVGKENFKNNLKYLTERIQITLNNYKSNLEQKNIQFLWSKYLYLIKTPFRDKYLFCYLHMRNQKTIPMFLIEMNLKALISLNIEEKDITIKPLTNIQSSYNKEVYDYISDIDFPISQYIIWYTNQDVDYHNVIPYFEYFKRKNNNGYCFILNMKWKRSLYSDKDTILKKLI